MRPKLIALDLDGTLMGEDRIIPLRTRHALRRAMDQGCLVTIATGRGFAPTARYAHELAVNAPLICYQGALIQDHRDETIVHTATIPTQVAQDVIAFSQVRQLNVQVYMEDGGAYASRIDSIVAHMAEVSGVPVIGVGDLAGWLDRPPLKFLFFVKREEEVPGLVHDLQTRFDGRVQVVRSWHQLVEVTGPNVSKGTALARLSTALEVPQSATMAVGDQDNDASMIAWAGVGVAMGDASPSAKAAADVIAPPLAAEGVAWAVERYVLGESS